VKADFDLNLSTRPFPAYRALNIGLAAILVALIGVSAWQAVGFRRYSRKARAIRNTEQELRVAADSMGQQVAQLGSRLDRPESTEKLNEIGFFNHLILRRDFSWTQLFSILEDIVPDNVHLVNLSPNIEKDGGITLRLVVRARSISDVTVFIKRLEMSPVFEKVILSVEQKHDLTTAGDVELTLTAVYYPQRDVR
jgi:Fimbrial assembly protein (PilN)